MEKLPEQTKFARIYFADFLGSNKIKWDDFQEKCMNFVTWNYFVVPYYR